MKRLFTALLVVLMVVALCSCGGGGGPVTRSEILTVGDYEFVFNGYELTKDAYGTDVVLITYTSQITAMKYVHLRMPHIMKYFRMKQTSMVQLFMFQKIQWKQSQRMNTKKSAPAKQSK